MTKFHGWAGTALIVDLTTGKIEKQALEPRFAREYLGASGFNSARLFDLVKPETEALGPDNVLMFGVGPLSGTLCPGSSRMTVTAKSPLTDIFGDSNMGGFFATELKFAGYDQIVVLGKAPKPVYLWIADDEVTLREASHLWGRSTWETASTIKSELKDPEIQVVCIGPAGENLVRMANIMCPTKRAAGRTGMGAVMGSKNLKAVAVRGTKAVAVARPDELLHVCAEIRGHLLKAYPFYQAYHDFGTPVLVSPTGYTGVRNFQRNHFAGWEALSGQTLKRDFGTSMTACPACIIACSVHHSVRSGEFAGVYGEGPEFAMTSMGFRWDADDLPALLRAHELLNQYGLDVTSTGEMIAWAMECNEKGILSQADLDGIALAFGDCHAAIEMIPKIAGRQGFGNILAEGEKRAPKLLGRGSEKYMHHVKGLGLISTDPRSHRHSGLSYLTSTRGADHLKTGGLANMTHLLAESDVGKEMRQDPEILDGRSPKGKGAVIKWFEDTTQVVDACGLCTRTGGSLSLVARALSATVGIDFSEKELLEIGERIVNVQKAFNSRLGLTRKDDSFSVAERFTEEPIKDGSYAGAVLEVDRMLDDYYKARGWDGQTGLQTRIKLDQLGLGHIADQLENLNALAT